MIRHRKKRGWTQENLAEELQTKQSVISRIESGNQNLTLDTLKSIADIFDTDVPSLLSSRKQVKLKKNRFRLVRR
ncbi:helix-turn-helix domain-containing protein [Domibacillus sp. A3M-37]|uniref:helix-turn-helix domain-containing protein n=1 Tax=Domibacillus sp. A3M-37 TaxID=2962037 RepID=UPI0035BF9854